MSWEVINGITGLVSALCALLSVGYVSFHRAPQKDVESRSILGFHKLASFVIACSGWALCCLSFLWVAEPFGSYPLPLEYQQFYGVIIAFPAIVIFMFGMNLLQGQERNKSSKKGA